MQQNKPVTAFGKEASTRTREIDLCNPRTDEAAELKTYLTEL